MTAVPKRKSPARWKLKLPKNSAHGEDHWVYVWRHTKNAKKGYVGMSKQNPKKYKASAQNIEFWNDLKAGLLGREIILTGISELRAAILEWEIFHGWLIPPNGRITEWYNYQLQRPTRMSHEQIHSVMESTAARIVEQHGLKGWRRSFRTISFY